MRRCRRLLTASRSWPLLEVLLAVAGSAVIFGLPHFSRGNTGIVQTTCIGLALAGAWLVLHRNLWVLVMAHACPDTLLPVQIYSGPSSPASVTPGDSP